MPQDLPERLEAGTMNVPGAAGLGAGLRLIQRHGIRSIFDREHRQATACAQQLKDLGLRVFSGPHQAATVSFQAQEDCETLAEYLGKQNIAVRAGLHCAPLAHESAGTIEKGTVRVSFGHTASDDQRKALIAALERRRRSGGRL